MERIGIYGGTFNPPHLGHIGAAQAAIAELRLDRMLLMPAFQSPDKEKPEIQAAFCWAHYPRKTIIREEC